MGPLAPRASFLVEVGRVRQVWVVTAHPPLPRAFLIVATCQYCPRCLLQANPCASSVTPAFALDLLKKMRGMESSPGLLLALPPPPGGVDAFAGSVLQALLRSIMHSRVSETAFLVVT